MRRGIGIPIIIINRDLATWPRRMTQELRRMKYCGPIIVLDNNSTNPETQKWYDELAKDENAVVIYARHNGGHKAPWTMGIPHSLQSQFGYERYIVTDPDLDLSTCPDTTIEHLLDLEANIVETPYKFQLPGMPRPVMFNMKDKQGPMIEIGDIPEGAIFYNDEETAYYQECKPIIPNYAKPNAPPMQPVPIDTTLALYNTNRVYWYGMGGARTTEIKVRHLPYYVTEQTLRENTQEMRELRYYLDKANHSSTAKIHMIKKKIMML